MWSGGGNWALAGPYYQTSRLPSAVLRTPPTGLHRPSGLQDYKTARTAGLRIDLHSLVAQGGRRMYIYIWLRPFKVDLKHPPEGRCVSGTVSESVSGCFRVCVSGCFECVSGVAFQHAFQPFLMARFRTRFRLRFRALGRTSRDIWPSPVGWDIRISTGYEAHAAAGSAGFEFNSSGGGGGGVPPLRRGRPAHCGR